MHALSLLIGVTTAATIIGAFVFGVPSIIAVVINYVKRGEARGTYLESHFRWQIRTFWFALLWCVIGGMLFITIVGILLALGVFFAASECGPSTGSLAGGWRCKIESRCIRTADCQSTGRLPPLSRRAAGPLLPPGKQILRIERFYDCFDIGLNRRLRRFPGLSS